MYVFRSLSPKPNPKPKRSSHAVYSCSSIFCLSITNASAREKRAPFLKIFSANTFGVANVLQLPGQMVSLVYTVEGRDIGIAGVLRLDDRISNQSLSHG